MIFTIKIVVFKKTINNILLKSTASNCGKQLLEVKKVIENEFSKCSNFSQVNLNESLDRILEYQNEWGANFLNDLFRRKANLVDFPERMINVLSFDRLQSIPFDKIGLQQDVLDAIYWEFVHFTYKQLRTEIINVPCTRVFDRILRTPKSKRAPLFPSHNSDGLDADFVHLATCGYRARSQSHRVCLFTNEKLEKWTPRIQNHLHIISEISSDQRLNGQVPEVYPGYIFQVNKDTGEIRDYYISVADHFDVSKLKIQSIV